MVRGVGAAGKTCIIKAMRGLEFDAAQKSTVGIGVQRYAEAGVEKVPAGVALGLRHTCEGQQKEVNMGQLEIFTLLVTETAMKRKGEYKIRELPYCIIPPYW